MKPTITVHILTPLAPGARIPSVAAAAIAAQSVECERFRECAEGRYEHRREHEAENRRRLLRHASDPITVLMDHDVLLGDERQIERVIRLLENSPDIDALAIDTKRIVTRQKEIQKHVCIACVAIRTEALNRVEWNPWTADGRSVCLCRSLNRACRIAYAPGERASEIRQSRG